MLFVFPTDMTDTNKVFVERLEHGGVTVKEIYKHADFSPLLIHKIARYIRHEHFDLVQTNLIHADIWMAFVKLFYFNKQKLVAVHHGFDPNYQAKYGFDLSRIKRNAFYWAQRFACRFTDHDIVISQSLKQLFVTTNIKSASSVSVIHYALNKQSQQEAYKEIVNDYPYAVIIGRLIPVKGHTYLINAWKEVIKVHKDFRLVIVGDGLSGPALKELVTAEKLDNNIVFTGYLPDPHPYIAGSVFTIVTSSWEGFGMIVLESWWHKKAVISFDAPAMNEMIENDISGILVPLNDIQELARRIIELYNNPGRAQSLGENGFNKLITDFSPQKMITATEAVYHNIVSKDML